MYLCYFEKGICEVRIVQVKVEIEYGSSLVEFEG